MAKEKPQAMTGAGADDCSNNTTSSSSAVKNQPHQPIPYRDSYNSLLRDVTERFVAGLDPDNLPAPEDFEKGLCECVLAAMLARNAGSAKEDQWRVPKELHPAQIGIALLRFHQFVRIDFSDGEETDPDMFPLHVYDEERGIYIEVDDARLGKLIREFVFTSQSKYVFEVRTMLVEQSPIVRRTRDANLVAVNNGVLHLDTFELEDFSPDYVFTCKTAVNWNPNATNVVITAADGFTWDIEYALDEIAGFDAEVREFLWRVIAATLRPNTHWDKSVWLYAKSGNNGKGTFCQIIRNLVGAGNHTSIPFADFNNNHFMLGALPRVQAVICDENQVGKYADDNVEFKSAVTGDVFRIDRKHKTPIMARFYGMVIQCVNEVPRIRDRSDSFWRRVSVVPFEKCFTGIERTEIKHDYIARQEILEYVQYRALMMGVEALNPPEKCELALEEFKADSNPVLQFAHDVFEHVSWHLLPWTFLYELFQSWYTKSYSKANSGLGRNGFIGELKAVVDANPGFGFTYDHSQPNAKERQWPSHPYMDGPELLILEYDLWNWQSTVSKTNPKRRATPKDLKGKYRGLIRIKALTGEIELADSPEDAPDDGERDENE